MGPNEAVRTVLNKYTDFSGRARRSEYWWFQLAYVVALLVVELLFVLVRNSTAGAVVVGLLVAALALGLLLPALAVLVRRLHDTGRSGWWYFISLVPFVGSIVLLVFLAQDSQPGGNQYGASPKEPARETTAAW